MSLEDQAAPTERERRKAQRARQRAEEAARLAPPTHGPVACVMSKLSVSSSTAYDLLARNVIRSARIGRSVRVDLADLDRYAASLSSEVA